MHNAWEMIDVWDMMNYDVLYEMRVIMKYEEWCMMLYMIWELLYDMITKPIWAVGTVMSDLANTTNNFIFWKKYILQ